MILEFLNKFRTKIPTLWYENEDGLRWLQDPSEGKPPTPPEGFIYQWSQFPRMLHENSLRAVLRSEVDKCDHDPQFIKRTGGWMEGLRGRECMQCNGTQVVNEEDYPDGEWPKEWDAEGSRALIRGEAMYPSDLVLAMLRPSAAEIARQVLRYGVPALPFSSYDQAVLYAAKACEACLNALCHRYGVKDGYRKGSKEWKKAGTVCELCDPSGASYHLLSYRGN